MIVDKGGPDFLSLRGVELRGRAEVIGEAPRKGESLDALSGPERLFTDKYMGGGDFRYDGRHGWLRVARRRSWAGTSGSFPRRDVDAAAWLGGLTFIYENLILT